MCRWGLLRSFWSSRRPIAPVGGRSATSRTQSFLACGETARTSSTAFNSLAGSVPKDGSAPSKWCSLNTDVLVDCLRGTPAAKAWLEHASTEVLGIPGVVAMELLIGCRNRAESEKLQKFL